MPRMALPGGYFSRFEQKKEAPGWVFLTVLSRKRRGPEGGFKPKTSRKGGPKGGFKPETGRKGGPGRGFKPKMAEREVLGGIALPICLPVYPCGIPTPYIHRL